MWVNRTLAKLIRQQVATRPAVLLTGARQTGKTSLLRHLLPEYSFVSLDRPSNADAAMRDPEALLKMYPPPLIIDEVQYAPSIFRYLKVRIDERRASPGQFVLTGSQKAPLMQYTGESLAGRIGILELEPLSRRELVAASIAPALTHNIISGGYPEIYGEHVTDVTHFYSAYIATYLERDVRQMTRVGSLIDFERFMRAAAFRSGQLLNMAELAREVGVSGPTISTWLSVLQASGIIVLLEPWFSNRLKSIMKSPKLYFADTGLLCSLLDVRNESELLRTSAVGAIWETFVFAELRRAQQAGANRRCYFLADRSKEVDFVLDHGGRLELFEAKWTEHPDSSDTAGIAHFVRIIGSSDIIRAAVISRTPIEYPINELVSAWTIDRAAQTGE